MNNLPLLTPRLLAVTRLARKGKTIADIGTDHAYIPVYMTLKGIAPCAIASDIKRGPLLRAQETIRKYGAEHLVKTVLSDGLANIDESSVDDIIIAGMGAETIISIISACARLHNADRRFILQPMSDIPKLRTYLYDNGFTIEKEALAKEGEKFYIIMSVKSAISDKPKLLDIIYGKLGNGEQEMLYLDNLIYRYERALNGLLKSRKARDKEKTLEYSLILKTLYDRKRGQN